MQLAAEAYSIRIKEIEAGHGELRPTLHAGDEPRRRRARICRERRRRNPPSACRPAGSNPRLKDEALFRGCTVVDPSSVLTTHLTELVRENMAELLSYAETQKLLDDLPREQQKLVADLVPTLITVGGVQRVLQALLAERVSIRDLPTILEGIQEACGGPARAIPADCRACAGAAGATDQRQPHRRRRLHPAWSRSSPDWEAAFTEALVGPPEDRQLAMAPTKLQEFMQRLRDVFETAAAQGDAPVLLTSGGIRLACARHRGADSPEHARVGTGRNFSARPDSYGRDDMSVHRVPMPLGPLGGVALPSVEALPWVRLASHLRSIRRAAPAPPRSDLADHRSPPHPHQPKRRGNLPSCGAAAETSSPCRPRLAPSRRHAARAPEAVTAPPAWRRPWHRLRAELGQRRADPGDAPVGDGVEITAALEPETTTDPTAAHRIRRALRRFGSTRCRQPCMRRCKPVRSTPLWSRPSPSHAAARPRRSPLLLVGPPGAGKTLTVARLTTRLVMAGLAPMVHHRRWQTRRRDRATGGLHQAAGG